MQNRLVKGQISAAPSSVDFWMIHSSLSPLGIPTNRVTARGGSDTLGALEMIASSTSSGAARTTCAA